MKNYINRLGEYVVLFNEIYDGTSGREINPVPTNRECFFFLDATDSGDCILKGFYKNIPQSQREDIRSWISVEKIEEITRQNWS